MKNKTKMKEDERIAIVLMYRSGNFSAKEICERFGIYHADLKRIVEEAGYGY